LNEDNIFVERLGGNEKLNPIAFGMQAALLIIVSLIKLINSRLGLLKFSFLLINLFVGLGNLFVAASKSPIIFTCLSILLIFFYNLRKGGTKSIVIILSILGLGVGLVIYFNLLDFVVLALSRFTEISEEASSLERVELLTGGINQFLSNPIFGSFLEEHIYQTYPHNLILESFMATGIIGGSIFTLFYLTAWYYNLQTILKTKLSFLPFISLSFLVMSLFSGGLSFFVEFWNCAAIIFPLYFYKVTIERKQFIAE
jgi:O-antigen ligase